MVQDIADYGSIETYAEKFLESVALCYKKTTSASEKVAGLPAQIDPTDKGKASIFANTGKFIGVFNKQAVPGYDERSLLNPNYARDGQRVEIIIPWITPKAVRAYIAEDQTLNLGDLVSASPTGFIKWTGSQQAVGRVIEAITTATEPDIGKVVLFPIYEDNPFYGLRMTEETVTVVTHTATLSNIPKLIEYAEALVQSGTTKAKKIIANATTPIEGEIYINYTSGMIKTNATDAVTSLKVRYWY